MLFFPFFSYLSFNPRTREGCDPTSTLKASLESCFNPRTREGCDGSDLTEFCHIRRFQSTHPRGVRLHKQVQIPLWSMFQSTHPRGVRLL